MRAFCIWLPLFHRDGRHLARIWSDEASSNLTDNLLGSWMDNRICYIDILDNVILGDTAGARVLDREVCGSYPGSTGRRRSRPLRELSDSLHWTLGRLFASDNRDSGGCRGSVPTAVS